jgi:hypothetical protein
MAVTSPAAPGRSHAAHDTNEPTGQQGERLAARFAVCLLDSAN